MRRSRDVVGTQQRAAIQGALERVDAAHAKVDRLVADAADLDLRREAHRELREAFLDADALLRAATTAAKQRSHRDWMRWRTRLSRLDAARQIMLFAENDDSGALGLGSVQAVDTGMSGPSIGEMQHGRSKAPGTPARYGLDLEAVLRSPQRTPLRRPSDPVPMAAPLASAPAALAAAASPQAVNPPDAA